MLTLYEHPFALYCQKVLVALNEQGIAPEVLEEQRDFDRAHLAELWPPASIPVLRDGDQIIGESSIIIEYVAGAQLVPSLFTECLRRSSLTTSSWVATPSRSPTARPLRPCSTRW